MSPCLTKVCGRKLLKHFVWEWWSDMREVSSSIQSWKLLRKMCYTEVTQSWLHYSVIEPRYCCCIMSLRAVLWQHEESIFNWKGLRTTGVINKSIHSLRKLQHTAALTEGWHRNTANSAHLLDFHGCFVTNNHRQAMEVIYIYLYKIIKTWLLLKVIRKCACFQLNLI